MGERGSRCPGCGSPRRRPTTETRRAYEAAPEHEWLGVVFCLGCGREYEPFALADDEPGPAGRVAEDSEEA